MGTRSEYKEVKKRKGIIQLLVSVLVEVHNVSFGIEKKEMRKGMKERKKGNENGKGKGGENAKYNSSIMNISHSTEKKQILLARSKGSKERLKQEVRRKRSG